MFNVSLQRIYLFLFFTGLYGFLSFWITITYFFNIKFFVIGGIIFYIFISLFHIGITRITARNETGKVDLDFKNNVFFIYVISLCIIYIFGVYLLQWAMINYLNVPTTVFRTVNWILNLFSLFISILFSFTEKKQLKTL